MGPTWAQFGPNLAQLGPNLGPTWAHFGPPGRDSRFSQKCSFTEARMRFSRCRGVPKRPKITARSTWPLIFALQGSPGPPTSACGRLPGVPQPAPNVKLLGLAFSDPRLFELIPGTRFASLSPTPHLKRSEFRDRKSESRDQRAEIRD